MLKYILFLLSGYYYRTVRERMGEICAKVASHGVEVTVKEAAGLPAVLEECEAFRGETLVISDEPQAARRLVDAGYYVVVLYHERNRQQEFPPVRYGVEDVFMLEYQSYEEAYKRLAGLPWDILETNRLKVRESTVEDVDEFYRIYSEPSITLYMENLYQDRDAELAYMKAYINQIYGFYGYGLWTVILKKTGQVIGKAGLSVREGYEMPELGFVIDTQHQNQGYGYEVCRAILNYAKRELAFDDVQALVKKENHISMRLLDKLGFVFVRDVTERENDYRLYVRYS
ncbi:MAG: GNAT family N-acetyltransferase [Clostridium sp.]|nr:GNAT family N-acetyltransferase [Clostridium sp.]